MALLLGVNPPDREPSFGGRGIMRSSGIRRPWMPAPLADLTTPIVRAIGVIAVAAAVALPGASVWMPRPLDGGAAPPPEERVRPLSVLINQPAPPAARVYLLGAPRDQAVTPPDRLSPTQLLLGNQPLPSASSWMPAPLRVSNTDPLRPIRVQAAPPDSTLVVSATLAIGRLPRNEDTTRPARPVGALVGAQPQPSGASVWAPRPLDAGIVAPPECVRPLSVISGPSPVPSASVWMLSPPRAPNTDPLRPLLVLVGAQPLPLAVLLPTAAPRDEVAPPSTDPLRPIQRISGQQPQPSASVWAPTPARVANTDPLRPLIGVAQPPDPTLVQPRTLFVGRLGRAEDIQWPARPTQALAGAQPIPGARVVLVGAVLRSPDRLALVLVRDGGTPLPGAAVTRIGRPRELAAVQPERLSPPWVALPASRFPAASLRWSTAPRADVATLGTVALSHVAASTALSHAAASVVPSHVAASVALARAAHAAVVAHVGPSITITVEPI